MKSLFFAVYICCSIYSKAQDPDTLITKDESTSPPYVKAEILSGGSLDVLQTGQMNASARLFKLFIGEPGKFQIPVSLFAGVSANNFSAFRDNDEFISNLINPTSGTFNFFFDGDHRIFGRKKSITSFHFQYQIGIRLLSAYLRSQLKSIQFLNHISSLGFSFRTGAWERDKLSNMGVFWLSVTGIFSQSPASSFNELQLGGIKPGIFGYSMGMGIEITKSVNVKLYYFGFVTNRLVEPFNLAFLQLSFNYSAR